jgi:DNA-binding SARP family transcriptional activator
MEFRILGPLEVVDQGRRLPLGAPKQRALLASLLLRANEIASTDRLIDDLWNDRPPDTAVKVVQVYVSQLRKSLGEEDRLLTRPPGYLLRVDDHELDARRFELLFEQGRRALAAGDAREAATTIREALALWRGPPLADLAPELFTHSEIARLEERKLAATIERIDADLALGRHADLIAELETLVGEHPLHERLRGQLMLALYRAGRQAEAVQAYQAGRHVLGEELGLEPGEALRALERAILTHDPGLDLPLPDSDVADCAPGPAGAGRDGDVTFAELVWEHFRWERERRDAGVASQETEARYRAKLAAFERREGTIADAYWCRHEASAAALTVRAPSPLQRLLGSQPAIRVHRVSDWITREAPAVADLLVRCDTLAIEAGGVLRGRKKRRALERIFSAEAQLLGLLERTAGRPSEPQTAEAARCTADLLAQVEIALHRRGVREPAR